VNGIGHLDNVVLPYSSLFYYSIEFLFFDAAFSATFHHYNSCKIDYWLKLRNKAVKNTIVFIGGFRL